MRWIWIDRITELDRATRCVAIKNISLAEDVLHDHFPPTPATNTRPAQPPCPVMPNTLIIEGMAQTAGILVGHAYDFSHRVILAKIAKATFTAAARPGHTLRHTALIERISDSGAATTGTVELIDPATNTATPLAEINLMFSHVDDTRTGLDLPDHNFVFTGQIMTLLKTSGLKTPSP